jgi:hypothetical protein
VVESYGEEERPGCAGYGSKRAKEEKDRQAD